MAMMVWLGVSPLNGGLQASHLARLGVGPQARRHKQVFGGLVADFGEAEIQRFDVTVVADFCRRK
jgi:hypothetical protein